MFTDKISQNIYWMIKNFNRIHSNKLSNKLSHFLAESNGKHTSRPEMVLNLIVFQFPTTEIEALIFGLKIATGIHQLITTNAFLHNYWNSDTDFS